MAEYVLNERTRTRRDWLATEHRSRLRRTGEGPQAAERWLFADSMSTATPPEVQGEIITPPEDRLSLCAAALRQSALRRADSHCCPPWPIRKAGLRCTLIRISTRFPARNIFERLMRLSFSGFLREHSKSLARSEPDPPIASPAAGSSHAWMHRVSEPSAAGRSRPPTPATGRWSRRDLC